MPDNFTQQGEEPYSSMSYITGIHCRQNGNFFKLAILKLEFYTDSDKYLPVFSAFLPCIGHSLIFVVWFLSSPMAFS